MNKNTKLLVLVLSLALMIGAVVGITAQAAESDPVILSQNVEYGGNYALMYAIKADSVKADEVTLAVYANAECTGEPLWDKTIAATAENQETVKDTACYVFTTAGIAAKDMDVQYYVKVTAGEGETVKRYSVAEYLYERLYKNGVAFSKEEGDVKRTELYNTVLLYGKQAQDVLCNYNNKTEDDRTTFVTDMKYVFVADGAGTVDGTFESGIFLSGSEVALKSSASIAGWTLYNAETGEAIKSIGANEPFTVDCHVKAAVTRSNRGSGKYANYKDTINYTNATLESLMASKDITTNTGNNGTLKSNKKVTFEDSSLVFTSTGSSWGSIDFWGHYSVANTSFTAGSSFVFETDIYLASTTEIDRGRASVFAISSQTGTGDGHTAFISIYSDPNSDGYILESHNATDVTTVVPGSEWVNIRFEAADVTAGSTCRFYINNQLISTSTLSKSFASTNGVQFRHASNSGGNGFSSGVMKLDNTYCGVIPFLGTTGTGAYASEALNYTGKTYADLTASGDITIAKNGATNSVVNVDSNDILKVNYKANGTWGRYSFKNSGEVTEGYVFETDILFNNISIPAGRGFMFYGTSNLSADAESKFSVLGFALVKNDDGSYYIRLNNSKKVAYTITENEWINVRIEADALSNSTVRLYVNGVLVDTYNFSSSISNIAGVQLMCSSTYQGNEGFTGNVYLDNTYVGAKK